MLMTKEGAKMKKENRSKVPSEWFLTEQRNVQEQFLVRILGAKGTGVGYS
jgi:hypothetical protein